MRTIFTLVALLSIYCQAHANFYKNHEQGWFWYKEKKPNETVDHQLSASQSNQKKVDDLTSFKKDVEQAKMLAIADPSIENIKHYLFLQKKVVEQSALFAAQWQKVLLEYPELSFRVESPLVPKAQHLLRADEEQKQADHLAKLAKENVLVLFVQDHCQYCEITKEIVSHISSQLPLFVVNMSINTKRGNEYPYSALNHKTVIAKTPTLAVFNIAKKTYTKISVGVEALDVIMSRLYQVGLNHDQ